MNREAEFEKAWSESLFSLHEVYKGPCKHLFNAAWDLWEKKSGWGPPPKITDYMSKEQLEEIEDDT